MLWNNPDNMPRHEVELTLLGAAILSGDGAIAHQVLELGTEYLTLCKLKIAAESGVDMHGLIHGWSLMDVVIARRCPGLASILVGIEVTSQKT